MGCRVLCLTLLALLPACLGQQCILITPKILRLESEETIVVDGGGKAFEADVEIHDFPKRILLLAKEKISLNSGNNFLGTATVTIPSNELTKDPKTKNYVYVKVKSPVCNLEKVILLSYQSGYVFIQTDKTIYTPESTVLYRIFSMNYKMSPVNPNVIIEFSTPENVIVYRYAISINNSGIGSLSYRLPELPSLGVWTISAKYEDSLMPIYSTNFEVKEYVPATYEITLIPEKKYFHVDDDEFPVNIEAKFLHGGPVNGMAFVIFGVKKDDVKSSLPNTLRRIPIRDGEGFAILLRRHLVRNFKSNDDMLQYTLYMSITLFTPLGSEIVESELEGIHIVKSSYQVLFTKTAKYFKPGMPYDLKVFVTNPDGSPARKVRVVAEPGKVEGITGEEGTARLTLNAALDLPFLPITVKTADPELPAAQQATASMTANTHQSDGNYLYIGFSHREVAPGDIVTVNFIIRTSNPSLQSQIQHVTYLIMNKGRILKVGRQPRTQSQALVTMSLSITEEFMPTFRIIAYYMVGNEIVSDSLRVDITDLERCIGTLLVTGDKMRDNEVQRPGSRMGLKLKADHKAYVGLVAIDKGLNVLNRKFKMSQKKVWDTIEKSDTGCTPGSGANSMGVFYDAGLALQSSFQTTTPGRSEPQCEVRAVRKRRSFHDEFEEGDYIPDEEIISRTLFPESWLWRLEQMTEKPDNKGISSKTLQIYLSDSITTWEILAVSLSPNKGICVAKPYEIQVKQSFVIDLKVPSSVVRNEQVEIRAVLYNYGNEQMKPEGVRIIKKLKLVTLEPQVKGIHGVQVETVPAVDANNIVPGTDIETIVTIQGTPFRPENVIDGNHLNHLIVAPYGSGEQNMMFMASTVITTIYLDVINHWDRIGVNQRYEAFKNIKQGYLQQLLFRKADSSYAAFSRTAASTWLTAFVVKVFAMVHSLVYIESNVLCDSIKWLILWKQKPEGMFKEDSPVYLQEMVGDIKGSSEDVSLTAFVLIAMLKSEQLCTPHVNILKGSTEKATNYLLGQLPGLTKPYTIAITSYALAMARSIDQPDRLLSAMTDEVLWKSGSRFITIEATSYALLALLRLQRHDKTEALVRWITEQKYYGDVFSNTQATFLMFQALAQYQIDITTRNDLNLDVAINLSENRFLYNVNPENAMTARSQAFKKNKEFSVTAMGKGQATLSVMSVYYALATQKEKKCKNFDLEVTVKEEPNVKSPEGILSILSVEICVRHLKGSDASMSILDVSMMTGFTPDIESLNKLTKGVDRYISRFEINKESITKGSLIIYLNKISHTQQECIKFNVHQMFNVGLIQPATVTVYDHSSPENRCTNFYHINKDSKLLGMICQKDVCRCAEGNCFLQQQLEKKINARVRFDKACGPTVDYVYKTRLEEIQNNDNYDNYVMKIISAIWKGTDERVLDQQRNFVSHVKCRKAINLKVGHDYLISGVAEDLWEQPSGYAYIIGKNTWIEQWPSERECQTAEFRDLCADLTNFSEELQVNGCS